MQTVYLEEFYKSKIDGAEDRYLLEYPENQASDLLVMYLHAGLSPAEQAFCNKSVWCFKNLRDEVMLRKGVYVSPEYRGNSWMNAEAEADTLGLILSLKERFGTKKLVLTGGSMGATAALIFASHHPDIIDGVIALCPATDMRKLYHDLEAREELIFNHLLKSIRETYGGTPKEAPEEYKYRSSIEQSDKLTMPIIIRHGEKDDIIEVGHARRIVEKLRKQGTTVIYDEIEGGNHEEATIGAPWNDYLNIILGS